MERLNENRGKEFHGDWLKVPMEYCQYVSNDEKGMIHFNKNGRDGSRCEGGFAHQRDSILYSDAFRKLSGKTQVFNSGTADYLRTRLTHTLEVSQIARNIAKSLGMDEELTEAIALAHDLGHTPFGHIGERALHKFSVGDDKKYTTASGVQIVPQWGQKGFKHNLQSVRILVDYTEGSEFSNFVLYGIREHSGKIYGKASALEQEVPFYDIYERNCSIRLKDGREILAWSFEAYVVRWADEIAQRHHDMEDAYLQNIMKANEILKHLSVFEEMLDSQLLKERFARLKAVAEASEDFEKDLIARRFSDFILDFYTIKSVEAFKRCLQMFMDQCHINSREDFISSYPSVKEEDISALMNLNDTDLKKADRKLGKALKHAILDSYEVQRMDGKSAYVIRRIVRAYKSNPQQLPDKWINRLIKVEIKRQFSDTYDKDIKPVVQRVVDTRCGLEDSMNWAPYECRNVLHQLCEDEHTEPMVFPLMMRIIFDYVGMMTDTFAWSEYRLLYG